MLHGGRTNRGPRTSANLITTGASTAPRRVAPRTRPRPRSIRLEIRRVLLECNGRCGVSSFPGLLFERVQVC